MMQSKRQKRKGPVVFARKSVCFLNGISTLVSMGLLGAGILLKYGKTIWKDKLASMFTSYGKNADIDGMDFSHFDFESVFGSAASFLIVTGIGALCLSLFGIVSISKKLFALSFLYTTILGIILLPQLAMVVVVTVNRGLIDALIKPSLVSSISHGYRRYNETDATSQAWSLVMVMFSCCGVDDYQDFRSARLWNRKIYQDGWWFELATPVPCCKMDSKQPDDFSCAVNPSMFNSNYENGCYEAVASTMGGYQTYFKAGIVALILIQIAVFVSAVICTKGLYKFKSGDKDNDEKNMNTANNATSGNDRYSTLRKRESSRLAANIFGQNSRQNSQDYNDPFNYSRFNNHYGDSFQSMFNGFNSSRYPTPYGVSSLLNAMHGMSGLPGMAGMMFQGYPPQRYGPMNRGPSYDMLPRESSLYTQNEAGLTSLGFGRASGPIIVQLPPAISNSPHPPSDSRRDSTISDHEAVVAELAENSRAPLQRQHTAPHLLRTVSRASNAELLNTKPQLKRNNTNQMFGNGILPPAPEIARLRQSDAMASLLDRRRAGTF